MDDPRAVLGVGPHATEDEVRRARRRLARSLHPDLHDEGTRAEAERRMALVNRAYDDLRRQPAPVPVGPEGARPADGADGADGSVAVDDAFVVDALPVDAFEAVLLAAVNLGDVMRAEEPYFLAVLLDDPGPCQCLVELVPDAGSTTVLLEIAPRHFGTAPSLAAVRDAFVAEIGRQSPAG